jgi:hypothetical protein
MSLSRRAFASGLAIVPLVAGKPQSEHRMSQEVNQASAPDAPSKPEWRPEFFDEHQLETVSAVAELIIPKTDTPGARDALVHQHLDHILAASPEADQTKFLEGLWWLDGYCLRSSAAPFAGLSFPDQMRILTHLYESSDPDLKPGTEFVHLAKTWTAKIYYSTQIGALELNKDGRVPAHYTSVCGA